MDDWIIHYLAGAMDADGSIGIRRSTTRARNQKDCINPIYTGRLSLKQTQKTVPQLLKDTFGGSLSFARPAGPNRKGMWCWGATCRQASEVCRQLLPWLLIKKERAQIVLDLDETKKSKYRLHSFWYKQEHPGWQDGPTMTPAEAVTPLGYASVASIHQAVRKGTVLAIRSGRRLRIPLDFVEYYTEIRAEHPRGLPFPPQLVAWKQRLWEISRELNKTGINGTPTYFRTGPFAPG